MPSVKCGNCNCIMLSEINEHGELVKVCPECGLRYSDNGYMMVQTVRGDLPRVRGSRDAEGYLQRREMLKKRF